MILTEILAGFQALMRRNDYDGYAADESDADWSNFYYHPCDDHMCGEGGAIHINCLPEEILVKIFSYLSACAISQTVLPVCKHW